MKKIKNNSIQMCFAVGFVVGILCPCLFLKMNNRALNQSILYFMSSLEKCKIAFPAYFFYVLRIRGAFWILWILSAFSIFGFSLSIGILFLMGGFVGMILTIPVLQIGFLGCLFGIVLLFPHYFIYIWGYQNLALHVIRISKMFWNKRTLQKERIFFEITRLLEVLFFLMLGILLETAVNPILLRWFAKKW